MKNKRKWRSVFMALVMPGMGQLFNGEMMKGSCLAIFFILIPLIIARGTVKMPAAFLLVGAITAVLAGIAVYFYGVVEAYLTSSRQNSSTRFSAFQNGFVYLAFFIVALTCMSTVQNYIRNNIVAAYKIVSPSMAPIVERGDFVLVDKTAYDKEPVARGDIIIHVFPDDRSKDFIRQVIALPGDALPDGKEGQVPHGTVLVKGFAHNDKIPDSESFGPVDMRDIVGKVRQIYFSKGAEGIRWRRIGKMIAHKRN